MTGVPRIASAVSCPVCSAGLGIGCKNAHGRPCSIHPERLARARALGVGERKPKRPRRRKGVKRRPRTTPAPGPVTIRYADGRVETVSQRSIRTGRKPKPQPEPRRSSPELEIPPWRLEER